MYLSSSQHIPLKERMLRRYAAEVFQALWRGYKTRKDLMEMDRQIVAEWAPYVEKLEQEHRLYGLCHVLAMHLRANDPAWDPQTSLDYAYGVKTLGERLQSLETWLSKKGWVRPVRKPLDPNTVGAWVAETYAKHAPKSM